MHVEDEFDQMSREDKMKNWDSQFVEDVQRDVGENSAPQEAAPDSELKERGRHHFADYMKQVAKTSPVQERGVFVGNNAKGRRRKKSTKKAAKAKKKAKKKATKNAA